MGYGQQAGGTHTGIHTCMELFSENLQRCFVFIILLCELLSLQLCNLMSSKVNQVIQIMILFCLRIK